MSAVITVQKLAKSFSHRPVLTDVSFVVDERDRIALVGVNGCGKSTLLRLVAAAKVSQDPADALDSGLVTKKRDLTLEYVPQEPRLEPTRAIGDVLRQALASQANAQAREDEDREHEIAILAASLQLPRLDKAAGELSIGERRRVALGAALLASPEVLALDEPTNHLDAQTVAWLETRLAGFPGALLLVTHDRYFLDRVATRILEIDRGKLYAYEGGYERFLELQSERLAAQSERERVRRAFVRRELDWIRRGPQARTTKQKARIDRFDAAVEAGKNPGERPDERVLSLRLPEGPRLGKTVLELHGVGKTVGGKLLFRDLSLLVKPGDRIGIVGDNGAGKTTLVRTLMGLLQPDEGKIVVGQNTRFAFLDQGRADLDEGRSVLEEVGGGDGDHVVLPDGPVHVRTFLRMMLFDDGFADMRVGQLSGGERNRVQLAKLLRQGGNVLVLDEPTNDLDLITLGVLEAALADFPGCALVVSHDRWFLDRVATGILAFEGGGKVGFYEGNYSSYLEKWGHLRSSAAAAAPKPKVAREEPAKSGAPAKPKKLSFKEQRELEGMEGAILEAEEKVATLEATLSGPDLYATRASEVPALVLELEQARAEVERLYGRWQDLSALVGG